MKDALAVLNAVDLNGYSRSKGFVGFFAATNEPSWATAIEASACCLQHALQGNQEAQVLSSAHVDPEALSELGGKASTERKVVERLVAQRLLPVVDYAAFGNDYASERYKSGVNEARSNFSVLQLDRFLSDELVDFFAAKMFVYGVFGHCFLYLAAKGLLVYPHEDVGFGVIATGKDSDHLFARRMLSDIGSGPLFTYRESERLRSGH